MPTNIPNLGFVSCGDKSEELDFLALYNSNLETIKRERQVHYFSPEQEKAHCRIAAAVNAATDMRGKDNMASFFLDSQDPEDGLFGNLMPTLDWF